MADPGAADPSRASCPACCWLAGRVAQQPPEEFHVREVVGAHGGVSHHGQPAGGNDVQALSVGAGRHDEVSRDACIVDDRFDLPGVLVLVVGVNDSSQVGRDRSLQPPVEAVGGMGRIASKDLAKVPRGSSAGPSQLPSIVRRMKSPNFAQSRAVT